MALLKPRNAVWARHASALVLVAAQTTRPDGGALEWAQHDTGQAVSALVVQATAMGLSVRQMGGFERDEAARAYAFAPELLPVVVVAVGRRDPSVVLPEPFAEPEVAPRTRTPLSELVLQRG